MAVPNEVQMEVGSPPPGAAAAPAPGAFSSFKVVQVVLFGLTVAGVVIGWKITAPRGLAPASSVAFCLTLAWALVGLVDTRGPTDRAGSRASPFHLLAAVDALVASVALAAGREAETAPARGGERGTSPRSPHWS